MSSSRSFGVCKGLALAPIVVPLQVIACIGICIISTFSFIDHGYFTLRLCVAVYARRGSRTPNRVGTTCIPRPTSKSQRAPRRCSTRYIGFNLKCVLALLLPVIVVVAEVVAGGLQAWRACQGGRRRARLAQSTYLARSSACVARSSNLTHTPALEAAVILSVLFALAFTLAYPVFVTLVRSAV